MPPNNTMLLTALRAAPDAGRRAGLPIGRSRDYISSLAFTIVKYAGAVYLVYLGVQALRAPRARLGAARPNSKDLGSVFRDGVIVALLNPKTAVFFAAFLPQFMGAERVSVLQGLVLGSMFVGIAATTDTAYAVAAGTVAPALARVRGVRALGRYLTAGALVGLGVFTAVAGSRGAK